MMPPVELLRFKTLIRQQCGLMCDGLAEDNLATALDKRMSFCGVAGGDAYYQRLQSDGAEFQELVHLLTINETYFFREPDHLTLLVDVILPRLLQDKPADQLIRILSAGCSSGEEPYSIAMAVLEKFGPHVAARIRIIGGDIDQVVLAKARAAIYNQFSFRAIPANVQDRYFRPVGRFQSVLVDQVRDLVTFQHLNLLAASLDPAVGQMDVVFFRNVSIYFDEPTRRRIHHTLHGLMADDGYLLTGIAETLANDLGVFRLCQENDLFIFRRGQMGAKPVPVSSPSAPVMKSWDLPPRLRPSHSAAAPPPPRVTHPIAARSSQAPVVPVDMDEIRRLLTGQHWDRALTALGQLPESVGKSAQGLALLAWARLQTRDFRGAEQAANGLHQMDQWSLDASVLLGLAAKWRDNQPEAVRWFKHAVYARHDCWVAQFYLAECHRAQGNLPLARRGYRVVLQQLGPSAAVDGGLGFPVGLSQAEIRFLCQRHADDGQGGN